MKTRVSFKYFVNGCLWKPSLASNLPETPSNLISLTTSLNLRSSTLFQPKIRVTKLQKGPKFDSIGTCFSDLFTYLEIWY